MHSSRLVIKSIPPGSSRVISVQFDGAGGPSTYSEMLSVQRDPVTFDVVNVSVFMISKQLTGWVSTTTQRVPLIARDTKAATAYADTSITIRRSLNSAEQRKVLELVDFLRKRCPP